MIDIIIASKNQAHFVKDTINSLLSQTTKDFKVICIDGFSNDGTDKLISQLPNVEIKYSNSSVETAYIEGILLSTSKYVAFSTTSDYLIDNDWLKIANETLDANPKFDIVWAAGINISESGDQLGYSLKKACKVFKNGFKGEISKYLATDFYLPELCYVIRRDCLIELIKNQNFEVHKIDKNKRYELWHFIINHLIFKNSHGCFFPRRVFAGRIHGNSVTESNYKNIPILKLGSFRLNYLLDAVLIICKRIFYKKLFFKDFKYLISQISILLLLILEYNLTLLKLIRDLLMRFFK